MKLVQINANYNKSSIGRTTAELHSWLLSNGHESYVFTPQYDAQGKNVYAVGNLLDHKLHSIMSRLTGLQAYFSIISTHKLIRKLDDIRPDIIHLRNLHGNYINLPLLLSYISKNDIACVITLHDCWLFTGHCCYYTKANCDKWKTGCHDCPTIKEDNPSWFFDFSKKIYNDKKRLFSNIKRLAVLGNSKWTMNQAEQSMLKNASIVEYVYNWIDQEKFYPRNTFEFWKNLNIQDTDFVILGVCDGWSQKKGLDVFLEIAKLLPDYKILLVGGIREEITLPSNIINIDKTHNNDELCEYYTHADVLLNPSLQETFGKVSAEALCCGTPIVVNRATANPELVGEGCGYIVDNNNIHEYLKYIKIIQGKGKKGYSDAAIRFAAENFDKETNILANIEIYTRLIKMCK